MTQDPAFGLLVAVPILLLAAGCVVMLRPTRRQGLVLLGCAVAALLIPNLLPGPAAGDATARPAVEQRAAVPIPATAVASPTIAAQKRSVEAAALRAGGDGAISLDVVGTRIDAGHADALDVRDGETIYVLGWAYDAVRGVPCDAVAFVIDAKRVLAARYGDARPDVASHFGNPALTKVGYGVALPASGVGRGRHSAAVICVDANGAGHASKRIGITVR